MTVTGTSNTLDPRYNAL